MSSFLGKCPYCGFHILIGFPVKEGSLKKCPKCDKTIRIKKLDFNTWKAEVEKA